MINTVLMINLLKDVSNFVDGHMGIMNPIILFGGIRVERISDPLEDVGIRGRAVLQIEDTSAVSLKLIMST